MSIVVQRFESDGTATLGEMFIDSVHECYTLEPAIPIPAGTYELTIDFSNRFQRRMPHVMNVPGHQGIRIHWGNWSEDTQLCTLVGTTEGKDFVGHSVDEFNAFFLKLDELLSKGEVYITYRDAPNLA
jgi:hypothetical protein